MNAQTDADFWVRSDRIKFVMEALQSAIEKCDDADIIKVLVNQAKADILRMQEYRQ